MISLPRDVMKWLQSLDLTVLVRNPRRDLSNGYVVAEIFSWYYPQEISMHTFSNGLSLDAKLKNWDVLKRFVKKHEMNVPLELIENTMHMKPDAAELLIQIIYNRVTNRIIKSIPPDHEIDFSDWYYQKALPYHARSTAAKAVCNNIKFTELVTDPNELLKQHKAQTIVNNHIEHRLKERADKPHRFDIEPSLGEKCVRRPGKPPKETDAPKTWGGQKKKTDLGQNDPDGCSVEITVSQHSPSVMTE